MSSSPFPYTCELCGAEGLTDEGMRAHTLEAHVAGRPECPFCDAVVPQPLLVSHVQRAHLHYLTPERELMAFIDDQSPSFDEDSKMTTTDSCSYNTPGSINGWHSPDTSTSFHNGAISKNSNYQNGYHEKERDPYSKIDRDNNTNSNRDSNKKRSEKEEERSSRSPKNLVNGVKNISISNGAISKKSRSRESSNEGDKMVNGHDKKGSHSSPSHNSSSYESSPNKSKLTMASAGQGSPLRSQLALKLKPNTPKKKALSPSPTVQCLLCEFTSTCPRKLEEHINRAHFDLTSPSVVANANSNSNYTGNPTLGLENPTAGLNKATLTLDNPTLAYSAMALSPGPHGSTFQCPICEREFTNGSDVEVHVNVDHKDILSPQKSEQLDNAACDDVVMMEESPVSSCPVCCQPLPESQHDLIQHIEEHFDKGEEGAASLTEAEREARKSREEYEFQMLKAQYGMEEDEESYTSRASSSLRRAVYSGALSVAGYYERSLGLRQAAAHHAEHEPARTHGLLERISELNASCPSIVRTYLCSAVDHYASTYGDRGWGCGYRNMQMLLSSLIRHPPYSRLLGAMCPRDPDAVPSLPRLQLLVERAWSMGFDTQGSEQLGCKLYNTRKWIGACEVVTVLSSFRIRCSLIDFHKPSCESGSHPALLGWVLRYFTEQPTQFKPPLYLQHQGTKLLRHLEILIRTKRFASTFIMRTAEEWNSLPADVFPENYNLDLFKERMNRRFLGHSRTIIGYEKHKDGKATLLVLDPSHSPAQVRQVVCGSPTSCSAALRLLRRGSSALRARQYQLLAVTGVLDNEHEYEASKVLQSIRIP